MSMKYETCMKMSRGLLFFFFSQMTKISFGSTILNIFWGKSGKETLISLLALGARNPCYTTDKGLNLRENPCNVY